MTEENPNPDQAPFGQGGNGSNDDGAPRGPQPDSPVSDAPPVTPSPYDPPPSDPAPPVPPASPAPWPPAEQQTFPSPEEDAAMRDQRARRYGAQDEPGEQPLEGSAHPAEPATQAFTPEPSPADSDVAAGPPSVTTPLPASPAAAGAPPAPGTFSPTGTGHAPVHQPPGTVTPGQYDGFEGFEEAPTTRAAAHWWTVLITLVFAPVAWYLVTDGGARIEWASSQSQSITVAAYIEFALGLVAVFIFLLAARWSSVGSIVMGSIFFALGIAFLIFPGEGTDVLVQSAEYFGRLGQFGINVVEHLGSTLETGRMVLYGLALIMVGVVSHGARRQGRREERTKIALGE